MKKTPNQYVILILYDCNYSYAEIELRSSWKCRGHTWIQYFNPL